MIKEEVYRDMANGFGCTIGMAEIVYYNDKKDARSNINGYILQSIDLGRYKALQRKLYSIPKSSRKTELTHYREILKELRNVGTKRG